MSLSLRARIVQRLIPKIMPGPELSPEEQRAKLSRSLGLPNRRVEVVDLQLGGVPVTRVTPKGSPRRRHLLHVHGGGFVVGTTRGFVGYLSELALRADAVVTSVDYRLAPEHPYPAAIDDCLAAYRALCDEVAPESLALIGESAGGNAVLATLVRARDEGWTPPNAAVLLSPWLDLTFSGDSIQANQGSEIMLDPTLFRSWRDHYVGENDPADPGISPLFADLAGLPPLHVQATSAEVLEDDARRLADKAREAGVEVELVVHDDLWHIFQTQVPLVPEASDALDQAVTFIRTHTLG
ncbi:alpha/beta hydrolase [Acidimicrobiia bacterium EGI L10123]|uniref:alpha/beta hydrolase n=1 Tax=Salinilacustrithrix flava TaxID=2957203 RepID=UPI003D7C15F3|nr:alpha/beta hydrolase [Acidimicrobiia bacterium EGI L10123]